MTFNYDDGTHSSTIYDAPNAELYADFLVTYDAAWDVTKIIFNYDDGLTPLRPMTLQTSILHRLPATFDSQ